MSTDPGDLVFYPTCGSGTTAQVAEQWGRRWITIDTSRVALALARTRLMAARYPWYLLADSSDGRAKEAELSQRVPRRHAGPQRSSVRASSTSACHTSPSSRSPTIPLIDGHLGEVAGGSRTAARLSSTPRSARTWQEWEIPRESGEPWDEGATKAFFIARDEARPEAERLRALAVIAINIGTEFTFETLPKKPRTPWTPEAEALHAKWWKAHIARQKEIDASIAARAEVEYLYDKPYLDNARVRVAGPFTVESLSPHRVLPASEEELIDEIEPAEGRRSHARRRSRGPGLRRHCHRLPARLRASSNRPKGDRITFQSLTPWPGAFIGAEPRLHPRRQMAPSAEPPSSSDPNTAPWGGRTLSPQLAKALDARFDVLIACAFNFDAHSSELVSLGASKILKARINPDMHMSDELKNTGRGNMFVVFGEPDVEILDDGGPKIRVKVQRRRRVRPQHWRHPVERHGGHRRLVHRHRL